MEREHWIPEKIKLLDNPTFKDYLKDLYLAYKDFILREGIFSKNGGEIKKNGGLINLDGSLSGSTIKSRWWRTHF